MNLSDYINSSIITAIATGLLVIVGLVQVFVLIAQKKQTRLELVIEFRKRWQEYRKYWGKVIFIGRNQEEYYQVIDEDFHEILKNLVDTTQLDKPTIWAIESIQIVCGLLSEICYQVLQGQLYVSDAYSIFGTELLRHGKPLRILLDTKYKEQLNGFELDHKHSRVRKELQDWLIYHDGIRRRCLILIDLLWAEAVRLEDLPPFDIKSAANAKIKTGKLNKLRVFNETFRLNGIKSINLALKMYFFLNHSEYKKLYNRKGIYKKRLEKLELNWTNRLLRK